MRGPREFLPYLALFTGAAALLGSAPPVFAQEGDASEWIEEVHGPLPRWREGGTPREHPRQRLTPFAIDLAAAGYDMAPTSGLLESPPEYGPTEGVLFRYSSSSWAQVVVDCVAALTGDPATDDLAYVVVSGASQQSNASTAFGNAGADLARVRFITAPTDSIWLRDYGPHFLWQGGALTIADSHYYSGRPRDNFIPTLLAEDSFEIPAHAMGLYYSGGNFQPGPNRSGFITTLIVQDNPDLTNDEIRELYRTYQGIDTLHAFPRLPSTVDGTGHIDMWMYLVDEDDVIISQFKPGSNGTAIAITENAVPYMESLGFTVHRVPAWNVGYTHYTYTNAFRVNDKILVPVYRYGNGSYADEDADALAAWQAAAGPGVELVEIDCYSIIPAAGAIHCIVMQVPEHEAPIPSAHVLSPSGGELLVRGDTHQVRWAASDDDEVVSVDLRYSIDGGATFPHVIATADPNDGFLDWTVPFNVTKNALLRVTAADGLGNTVDAVSSAPFEIRPAPQRVYDFSTGAGVDKWAYGYQTSSWSELAGVRYPAAAGTDLEVLRPGAYAALALSDATGSDSDPARYIAPAPSSGKESTHVFDFVLAEDPADLVNVEIVWEGYGDDCIQMELYVWDNVAGDWCDTRTKSGANAYMLNFAGNRDQRLEGHIREDFERFVDASGVMTILLYGERSKQESFHDYVSIVTTYRDPQLRRLGGGDPPSGYLPGTPTDLTRRP